MYIHMGVEMHAVKEAPIQSTNRSDERRYSELCFGTPHKTLKFQGVDWHQNLLKGYPLLKGVTE